MQASPIFRITGILLTLFSITMLTPIPFALYYAEGTAGSFLTAFGLTLGAGLAAWIPVARSKRELRNRDGFFITVLFYLALGLFGALPLWLEPGAWADYTDAAFESLSGLTTTGATVITGLDALPKSVLFYRQQLQWLGGMGIIVLAVAILPMLGIGGMQLYRAEMPGPVKDSKLTPRITETAKALWYIYLTLTIACGVAYWAAGMSMFDALCHSFSTVAIGGFSTHDASLAYFDSPMVESIAVVFMLLCGINFGLHFVAWRRRTLLAYLRDPETRAYFVMLGALAVITVAMLADLAVYDWSGALRKGLFQVVSIATTTGFTTTDFSGWPTVLPYLLLFSAFTGACAGSTGGGMKVVRVMLIVLQGLREVKRLIHPAAVIPVKLGRSPVPDRVIDSVWSFFSAYVIVFLIMVMVLLTTGLDFITAFSAVAASLNNLGPGLGDVALHYGSLPDAAKWTLCIAMLLGRLEIFTLLVLVTPAFWRS
ncbi:MAG: TrkH family potassium uptake protein [Pseudomonadales bacterium]|jgi:trk system potassium uptake protein TrkH|nr:TrkH family potassium uptake protein [Pseudomonadales bacterium]